MENKRVRSKSTNPTPPGTGGRSQRKLLPMAHRVSSSDHVRCIREYLAVLDCPRSLTVWFLFKYNEHDQLAGLSFNPDDFLLDFIPAYRATQFLSKYQDFNLSINRKSAALEKFLKYEELCKRTNRRFMNLSSDPNYRGQVPRLHIAVISKIKRILGPCIVADILEGANWGPGATTLIKGSDACSANKFQNENGITRDLAYTLGMLGYYDTVNGFSPLWSSHLATSGPNYQVGNKLEFVPKSSTIDRPIAKEPGLNLWIQKAIGLAIRRRLRKWGVDLNSQSRNQMLSRKGSISNLLATIDFSSASDSIAKKLVEELLPPDWFQLLDRARSHYGSGITKHPTKWEKFSSMGNGFTFELESLIFYALSLACVEDSDVEAEDVSVFGDDVIIPSVVMPAFSEMASFYGLVINGDKSFVCSDFPESCGEHYYRETSAKPFFLKKEIRRIPDLFRFHNSLIVQSLLWFGRDKRYRELCQLVVRLVPKTFRFRGPLSHGDTVLSSNLDEAVPSRLGDGHQGYLIRGLVDRSILFRFSGIGLLLAHLWRLEQRNGSKSIRGVRHSRIPKSYEKGEVSPVHRKGFTQLTVQRMAVFDWQDLGPWL